MVTPEAVEELCSSLSREGEAPDEPFWIGSLRLPGSAGASLSRIVSQLPSLGDLLNIKRERYSNACLFLLVPPSPRDLNDLPFGGQAKRDMDSDGELPAS